MIRSLRKDGKTKSRLARRTHDFATLGLFIVVGALSMGVSESFAVERAAHAARALNGTATAHLHLVRAEGSQLIEDGPVSGVLVGTTRAQLNIGAVFTGSFTIHTRDGSIMARGQATPHGAGRYQSFSGSFLATHGNGRYAHIRGHAGLYGVFDRRTDSVIIQTTGKLTY